MWQKKKKGGRGTKDEMTDVSGTGVALTPATGATLGTGTLGMVLTGKGLLPSKVPS